MATLPTADELRDWMEREGRGYKAAAKHFGIKASEARKLCGARVRERAPTREASPPLRLVAGSDLDRADAPIPLAQVDLEAELVAEIEMVKRNLADARSLDRLPLQSIERLSRHKMNMIAQLAQLQESAEPEAPPLEASEALHLLKVRFAQLAPMDRERLLDALRSTMMEG